MDMTKLFSTLTLAAFVGVVACETQDDNVHVDDTAPAAEQPATTDDGFDDGTWDDPATDDTWDDDAATTTDGTWDDDAIRDDELEDDRDDLDNY